jgi:hypothetical protein
MAAIFLFFDTILIFHCLERLGSRSSSNQSASCKEILQNGSAVHDGTYFIDPGNSGKPIRVYCDMTTDGGEALVTKVTLAQGPSLLFSFPL